MHMADNGNATIAGVGNGIFVVDRPAGGSWGAATTLATPIYWGDYALDVPQVILTGDANGDEAVVWEQMDGGGTPETIMAIRRPAGGTWGQPETVYSQPYGLHIPLAGAAMGPKGDLLVSFETYNVVCVSKHCADENFTVYAAREQAGSSGWTVSGALSPPVTNTYGWYAKPVIDASGQGAVICMEVNNQVAIQAVSQNASNLKWSTPVTVYSNAAGMSIAGTATGGSSQASLAFVSYVSGSSAQIAETDGNLGKNRWSTPLNLSSSDATGGLTWLAFGGNQKGGRAALWSDNDGSVRASLRKSGIGTFGAASTLLSGACTSNLGQCFTPEPSAVAINASGQAVAVFLEPVVVGTTPWSLYAATTN